MSYDMTNEPIYCLIVDDDAFILDFIKEALSQLDLYIIPVNSGQEAIDTLASGASIDILVTDLNMPAMSGEELIRRLQEISPRTIILVMTGYATIPSAVSLMRQGIFDYLTKPVDLKNLLDAVERAIAEVENRRKKHHSSDIQKIWRIGQFFDQNLTSNRILQEFLETAIKISEANGGTLWLSFKPNNWEEAASKNFEKDLAKKIIVEEIPKEIIKWDGLSQEEITGNSLHTIVKECEHILVVPFLEENHVVALLLLRMSLQKVFQHTPGLLAVFCCQLSPIINMSTRIIRLLRSHEEAIKAQSDLEKVHEDLKQSSKLAAIGELSASIIHDINAPLTCIIGFLQLFIRFLDKPNVTLQELLNARDYIQRALSESQRCQQLVQDLLLFSRKESKTFQPFDLHEVLDRIQKLLCEQFRTANITFERQIPNNLPKIMGNSNQIQQVFVNLFMNAKHAIEPNAGKITISAELPIHDGSKNKKAKILVQDTGKGIEPANISKIFQPFFTTNAPGKGTGLGLSITKKIVTEHDGEIFVSSEIGKGTTFTIFLPIN